MADHALHRTGLAAPPNLAPPVQAPDAAPDTAPAPPRDPNRGKKIIGGTAVAAVALVAAGFAANALGVLPGSNNNVDPSTVREPGTSAPANPGGQPAGGEKSNAPSDPLEYCRYLLGNDQVQAMLLSTLPGATVSPDQCVQPEKGQPHVVANFQDKRGNTMTMQVAPANLFNQNEPSLEARGLRGADWAYVSNVAPNFPYIAMGKDGMAIVLDYNPAGTRATTEADVTAVTDVARVIAAN